ncbi:AbrB/MazE/SpoVT family DNA-binding domain-containing protein [Candidatus Microgenomates bacterium]|nr:AbrB/MazE/SpoVT family DNA-binding domain-containing protein [Candidatus Microgenomates bacterium]
MNLTTTLTSKAQITIPKPVRERLGLKKGTKIDIFPIPDGSFVGRPRRKSNIMKFAGSLAHLDDGRSWKEIREETERLAAQELVSDYDKLTQRKNAKLYRIKFKK